jgi:DNA-binding response OmpR family regulator
MSGPRVLVADNFEGFLTSCAEFLELQGFDVVTARSVQEAEEHLAHTYLHAAVLDMRLREDTDRFDNSGLDLAKRSDPSVVKIIFTEYATIGSTRDAMCATESGPPVFYYLTKEEGLDELLNQLKRAIASLGIDQQLSLVDDPVYLSTIARHLTNTAERSYELAGAVREVSDLLRKVFHNRERVQLGSVLWRDDDRMAVLVEMLSSEHMPGTGVLVCGRRSLLDREHEQFVRTAPHRSSAGIPVLDAYKVTTHFAALLYVYDDGEWRTARPLVDLFTHDSDRIFASAVTQLFERTLPAWQRGMTSVVHRPECELLRERASLQQLQPRQIFQQFVSALTPAAEALGVGLTCDSDSLHVRLDGVEQQFTNPARPLEKPPTASSTFVVPSPGRIDSQSVWVDAHAIPLLTDFLGAGAFAPGTAYAELEAAIRFDWVRSNDPARIVTWERQLVFGELARLKSSDVSPEFRKSFRAILLVRRLLRKIHRPANASYNLGLLIEVFRRINAIVGDPGRTVSDLFVRLHLVMAAGMLASSLESKESKSADLNTGLRLDPSTRTVLFDGASARLRPQAFRLFAYLVSHNGTVCSLEALVVEALGDREFDPQSESQAQKVSTAIHRLRDQLTPLSALQRCVQTVGVGYRFESPK